MRAIRGVWALACKDLRVEARAREAFATMLFFAALVLLVFNFALEPGSAALREAAGGLLWVAFLFTGMLALGRSFQAERENECLEALVLSPAPREAIFFGKFAGNLMVMLVAEALILVLFGVLQNLDLWGVLPQLALVGFLGTVGFAAVGTLVAAMASSLRAREVLLPLLLIPLVVPVVLGAVRATEAILVPGGMAGWGPWLQLLAVFDVMFLAACPLVFEFVVEG